MKLSIVALVATLALAAADGLGPWPGNEAGYIPVRSGRAELFYWMFPSMADPENDPWVIWLSGGPGCSSMLALFAENGPYVAMPNATSKDDVTMNPYAWSNNATVVWLDQPVGTGFSYGRPDAKEDLLGDDFLDFVLGLMGKHPELKDLPFHIFGESYAGHYVPQVSHTIMAHNSANPDNKINHVGSAVGNGLTAPLEQYKHYAPFAADHDLVTDDVLDFMEELLPVCERLIAPCENLEEGTPKERKTKWETCIGAAGVCSLGQETPISRAGWNVYDVRLQCLDPPLCYDFSDIDNYLNLPDVVEALGVKGKWKECSKLVDLTLQYSGDLMLDYSKYVVETLEGGLRWLIYAGDQDFICNWYGNHAWTDSLAWSGSEAFGMAKNTTFQTTDGRDAGTYKSANGLTFLRVNGAGHMVPMDQPLAALQMTITHYNDEFTPL